MTTVPRGSLRGLSSTFLSTSYPSGLSLHCAVANTVDGEDRRDVWPWRNCVDHMSHHTNFSILSSKTQHEGDQWPSSWLRPSSLTQCVILKTIVLMDNGPYAKSRLATSTICTTSNEEVRIYTAYAQMWWTGKIVLWENLTRAPTSHHVITLPTGL